MKKDISTLYFPALIPRQRQALKWCRRGGYDLASVLPGAGGIKVVPLPLKAKNAAASGKRILFFSDLHYSSRAAFLGDALVEIARRVKPDLVLCGGDLCTDSVSINALAPFLEKLSASAPLCATVPGNWERGKTWLPEVFWKEFFTQHNWLYLCNEALEVENWGWIYGCDDISRGFPAILATPPADREKILLVHRPDTVIAVDRETPIDDFTAALCGHTHGGQIRLPLIGAITAPSFYGRRFDCGIFQKDQSDTRMIVSTGVNHASFPWRIFCRRELLLIDFE